MSNVCMSIQLYSRNILYRLWGQTIFLAPINCTFFRLQITASAMVSGQLPSLSQFCRTHINTTRSLVVVVPPSPQFFKCLIDCLFHKRLRRWAWFCFYVLVEQRFLFGLEGPFLLLLYLGPQIESQQKKVLPTLFFFRNGTFMLNEPKSVLYRKIKQDKMENTMY